MGSRGLPRVVGLALALGIATGLTAACSSDSGASTAAVAPDADNLDAAPEKAPSADTGQEDGAAGEQRQAGSGTGQPVSQPGMDRKLVRTAELALTAADVDKATTDARMIATSAGGYAGSELVREESATITLHVPSDRFDQVLVDLSALGEVTARSQTAEDVTEELVDVDSRVANQRESVERMRVLLRSAKTIDEIVRIESELTSREADLESLLQRREALAGQVAMSTITVRVTKQEKSAGPPRQPDEDDGFLGGLADGWDAFLTAGGVLLRVFGAVLPFAVVLGVPGFLAYRWLARRLSRRQSQLAAATQPPATA